MRLLTSSFDQYLVKSRTSDQTTTPKTTNSEYFSEKFWYQNRVKMLIKTFICLQINNHFHEEGRIPSFRIGCWIWWTRQKNKKVNAVWSLSKEDNESKHFIIATTIEQFCNWSIKLRDYILNKEQKKVNAVWSLSKGDN